MREPGPIARHPGAAHPRRDAAWEAVAARRDQPPSGVFLRGTVAGPAGVVSVRYGIDGAPGGGRSCSGDQEDRQGYVLYSKDGSRKLVGPYKTRADALRRERQVQFFKHAKNRGG